MALKQIPLVEQSLLCASVNINNYQRAIEELVYNSLDAASTSIAIRVCIQENFIQVLDNGIGIKENNFSLLGQKYATSKYVDINTLKSAPDKYGFKGLSLANIIDVSTSVKIISRFEDSNDTWQKKYYKGKEIEICKCIPRPSKGTTVEIKGFLYNLNIQRLSIDINHEICNIETALHHLSLAHLDVSISLRDEYKNDIIFQIHKNRDIYKTLWTLFELKENDLQELQVQKNEYKVKAYIGKNSIQSSYSNQLIYLNGKFISKSALHKIVNENISKMLYGRNNKKSRNVNEHNNNCDIPFYFISITCPNYDFDIIYTCEKSLIEFKDWNEINKLLEKLAQFYCEESCLVPKKIEMNKIECKKPKLDTRTRVKEIMEKILNNRSKHPRISQLQNGVKGNILKRKHKKSKISAQKINKSSKGTNPQSTKFHKLPNKLEVKRQTLLKQNSHNLKKSKHTKIKSITYANKLQKLKDLKENKISASKLNKKLNTKDCIIKKFEEQPISLESQCKYLNTQVEKFLDKHISKTSEVYNNITKKRRIQNINNNKKICVLTENKKYNGFSHPIVKKSSDLIKTVMGNQYNMSNPECTHEHINSYKYSYRKETKINIHNKKPTIETYNSHNYNIESVNQTLLSHIIDENSPYNINVCRQKLNFNDQLYKIRNNNSESSISNDHKFQKSEKKDCYEIISNGNDLNFSKDNHEVTPQVDMGSLQFASTYTVKNYRSVANYDQLNKSISLHISKMSNSYHIEEVNSSNLKDNNTNDGHNHNNKNVLILSQSDSDNDHEIEPIHFCEAVIHNSNQLQEFENSFLYSNDNVCLPNHTFNKYQNNIRKSLNMNNNLEQIKENFENNLCEAVIHSSNQLKGVEKEFENSFRYRDNVYLSNHTFNKNQNNIRKSFNVNNNLKQIKENFENNQKLDDMTSVYEFLDKSSDKKALSIGKCKSASQKAQSFQGKSEKINNFEFKSRHRFMPKGMSPITRNNNIKKANSFNGDEYYKDTIYEKFANDILVNSKIFELEVQNVTNILSKDMGKLKNYAQNNNTDLIFDSQSLKEALILGQVDRKFIAAVINGLSKDCKCSKVLVLFDQHAVDERINLENNLSDYVQENKWKSVNIDPVSLVLNKDYCYCFLNNEEKFTQFGLRWTFTTENVILLKAIPKAIIGKNPREVDIIMKAVNKLILEQIKSIKTLRGNVSLYPKAIMELVHSEACRYAVKFGDKLSKIECTNMIDSLAYCKTPFQCAHGRPVMAVMMELTNNIRSYTVNGKKFEKFKKIL